MAAFISVLKKVILKYEFYIQLKKLKIDYFFQKLLFSTFINKIENRFFLNFLIILKNYLNILKLIF